MSRYHTNPAWEQIFKEYDILSHIHTNGYFEISAKQIVTYREPRLMVKFDHSINLPKIFQENGLAILPISGNSYVISHFENYHSFENIGNEIKYMELPFLESLSADNIKSETIAINCAYASGILSDFLQEDTFLYPTVAGKMGSGNFDFFISNKATTKSMPVSVSNSRIEIDAAYEGASSLALIEAKCDLSDDFLVRQLYYPYRTWTDRISKNVRPIFLVYSNSCFNIYEYKFTNKHDYNSLQLVKNKRYSIEDTTIEISDIQNVIKNIKYMKEPEIPFPQADSLDRIINLCELLAKKSLSRDEITEEYAFDKRQTSYYTAAADYLNLVERGEKYYKLSKLGQSVMSSGYKTRQLKICELILSHKVFGEAFKICLERGRIPDQSEIINLMKSCNLYHIDSNSTYKRRASTISAWLNWIARLTSH
ncbi:MAG: hypothetical protein PUB69_03790 [Desulfovibrionaceae bacterium]|nr:hypothetical protein [Desulfovibrionaceae bacterium]